MKLFFGEIFPEVRLADDEMHHIVKVLRMREGEEIAITDGKGNLAKGKLVFEGKKVSLNVQEIIESSPEFEPQLHIAIAPTKNIDRIEFFAEKATEMGISEISFIQAEKSERKNLNFDKLKKQIIAASKQSLRFHFPTVNDLVKLPEFLKNIDPETTFVAHCNENLDRTNLSEIVTSKKITFLIGPEGDFTTSEIGMMAKLGIKAVSLGNQRLRTETAGLFVAAWVYGKSII